VTGVDVTIGNCFPSVWEILPDAEGGGNISQTEGKQFPIMTDNFSLFVLLYPIAYCKQNKQLIQLTDVTVHNNGVSIIRLG